MLIINLTVIKIVINTMFTYPWKNDQKTLGWQFTAAVNYPFSRQFSQTEAHTINQCREIWSRLSIPSMSMDLHIGVKEDNTPVHFAKL